MISSYISKIISRKPSAACLCLSKKNCSKPILDNCHVISFCISNPMVQTARKLQLCGFHLGFIYTYIQTNRAFMIKVCLNYSNYLI
jgi:hypothetical protein